MALSGGHTQGVLGIGWKRSFFMIKDRCNVSDGGDERESTSRWAPVSVSEVGGREELQ